MNLIQWKNSTLKNYVKKHSPAQSEVDHVLDYLHYHPDSKLKRASYPHLLKKSLSWVTKLNKKNKALKEAGLVEIIRSYPEGLKYVRLIDQTAKDWESKHMGHCVASYRDHDGIYSLRDSGNMPHVTVEINNHEKQDVVRQAVGKFNRAIPAKYLPIMLEQLSDVAHGKEVCLRSYTKVSRADYQFLKSNFTGINFVSVDNEILRDRHPQVKLKENHKITDYEMLRMFLRADLRCPEARILIINKLTSFTKEEVFSLTNGRVDSCAEILNQLGESDNENSELWAAVDCIKVSPEAVEFLKVHFKGVSFYTCASSFFAKAEPQLEMIIPFTSAPAESFKVFISKLRILDKDSRFFDRHDSEQEKFIQIILQYVKIDCNIRSVTQSAKVKKIINEKIALCLSKGGHEEISPWLFGFIQTHFKDYDIIKFQKKSFFKVTKMTIIKNASDEDWTKLNEEINYPSTENGYSSNISSYFCKIFRKTVESNIA